MSFSVLHSWIRPLTWEELVAISYSPMMESKRLLTLPPSPSPRPSPDRGEAMVKVGGEPSCRAGAEPRFLFLRRASVSHLRGRRAAKSGGLLLLTEALIHGSVFRS